MQHANLTLVLERENGKSGSHQPRFRTREEAGNIPDASADQGK